MPSVPAISGRQKNRKFRPALPKGAGQIETADPTSHDDVRQHELNRGIALEDGQCTVAVVRLYGLVSDVPQQFRRHRSDLGVVLDDEDTDRHGGQGILAPIGARRRKGGSPRQEQGDRRAFADLARKGRGPAALLSETVDLREAEPRA